MYVWTYVLIHLSLSLSLTPRVYVNGYSRFQSSYSISGNILSRRTKTYTYPSKSAEIKRICAHEEKKNKNKILRNRTVLTNTLPVTCFLFKCYSWKVDKKISFLSSHLYSYILSLDMPLNRHVYSSPPY